MRQLTIDLLQSHEKLIASIANKFGATTGFDVDELISYGRYVAVVNARKWEPSRGKFSTFLYWLLRSSFIDYINKQRKEVFVEVYEDTIAASESYSAIPTMMVDLLDNLSADAKALVEVALSSKWTEHWQNLPALLKEMMLKQGWTADKFDLAFSEVQAQVRTW